MYPFLYPDTLVFASVDSIIVVEVWRMFKQKFLFIMAISASLLAACASPTTEGEVTAEISQTAVAITPTPVLSASQEVGSYMELLNALQSAGATVTEEGELDDSFFSVAARLIRVNGADVQVFEFADEQTQSQASATISQAGYAIGTSQIEWIDRPNFWAQGRLIVLYVGQDEAIISLLTDLLGERINLPDMGETPPEAVTAAINQLASALAVAAEEVEIVSFGQQEWPDGCLGLAEADEMCTQAIVPGWQLILAIGEQQYEVRTNQTGSVVRWRVLEP